MLSANARKKLPIAMIEMKTGLALPNIIAELNESKQLPFLIRVKAMADLIDRKYPQGSHAPVKESGELLTEDKFRREIVMLVVFPKSEYDMCVQLASLINQVASQL